MIPVNESTLGGGCEAAVAAACSILFPGLEASVESCEVAGGLLAVDQSCVLAIFGAAEGFLVIGGCEPSPKRVATALTGLMLSEDYASADPDRLDETEESTLRELCNVVGANLVDQLPPTDGFDITFPVFLDNCPEIVWDYPVRSAVRLKLADCQLKIHAALQERSEGAGNRITTVAQLRDRILRCVATP